MAATGACAFAQAPNDQPAPVPATLPNEGLTPPQPTLDIAPLSIDSGEDTYAFAAEVADEPLEIATGMMGRTAMGDFEAMLFDFGTIREASFWMKDTLISLDMLFIDSSGEVVAIAENAEPLSVRQISPGIPVRAVIEIRGGRADELDLQPGDTVLHEIFGNAVPAN